LHIIAQPASIFAERIGGNAITTPSLEGGIAKFLNLILSSLIILDKHIAMKIKFMPAYTHNPLSTKSFQPYIGTKQIVQMSYLYSQ
jgi:hypothetical protein